MCVASCQSTTGGSWLVGGVNWQVFWKIQTSSFERFSFSLLLAYEYNLNLNYSCWFLKSSRLTFCVVRVFMNPAGRLLERYSYFSHQNTAGWLAGIIQIKTETKLCFVSKLRRMKAGCHFSPTPHFIQAELRRALPWKAKMQYPAATSGSVLKNKIIPPVIQYFTATPKVRTLLVNSLVPNPAVAGRVYI